MTNKRKRHILEPQGDYDGFKSDRRAPSRKTLTGQKSQLHKLYPEVGDLLTQKEIDMQGYTPKAQRHNESYPDRIGSRRMPTRKKPESGPRELTLSEKRIKWEREHMDDIITGALASRKKKHSK